MTDVVFVAPTGGAVRLGDGGTAGEPTRITLDLAMKRVGPKRSKIDGGRRPGLLDNYRLPRGGVSQFA